MQIIQALNFQEDNAENSAVQLVTKSVLSRKNNLFILPEKKLNIFFNIESWAILLHILPISRNYS